MVVAHCNFLYQNGSYDCVVTSLNITEPNTVVTEFRANAMNIKRLIIDNQNVHYFPNGIPQLLPNLQELTIKNCRLKEVEAAHLMGFDKLVQLDLSQNRLDYLPDDLFTHVPQLRRSMFNDNHIKFRLLEPLTAKEYVNLLNNKVNIIL